MGGEARQGKASKKWKTGEGLSKKSKKSKTSKTSKGLRGVTWYGIGK